MSNIPCPPKQVRGSKMKPFWQSKTVLFNAAWAAVLAFCSYEGIEISENVMEVILLVGNVLLRFITNGPISLKQKQQPRFYVDPETGFVKKRKIAK